MLHYMFIFWLKTITIPTTTASMASVYFPRMSVLYVKNGFFIA